MQIDRPATSTATRAPEPTFTGEVLVGGYARREAPSRLTTATISHPPGARTSWKVNPLGQTLVVLSGSGRVQVEGEPVAEVVAGDVVWCPPGVRHCDGAAPDEPMSLVALHEGDAHFGDTVTDEQYAV